MVAYSFMYLGGMQGGGAGLMPSLSGCGIVLFSIFDLLVSRNEERAVIVWSDFAFVALICVAVLFYVFLSDTLGFIVTSVIIVTPLVLLRAQCSKFLSIFISVAFVIFIYYLFSKVLLVPLP